MQCAKLKRQDRSQATQPTPYKKLNIPSPTTDCRNLKYSTTFLYLNSEEIVRAAISLNRRAKIWITICPGLCLLAMIISTMNQIWNPTRTNDETRFTHLTTIVHVFISIIYKQQQSDVIIRTIYHAMIYQCRNNPQYAVLELFSNIWLMSLLAGNLFEAADSTSYNADNPVIIQLFKKDIQKNENESLLAAHSMLVEERDSLKKMRFIFVSNTHVYITRDATTLRNFAMDRITNVIIAGLSGEIALLMNQKEDTILDSLECKSKLISIFQTHCKKDTQFLYVNSTTLKPYLRKDDKTKTFIKPIGKYLVDLRKVEESLHQKDRVMGLNKYTLSGIISESDNSKIYYALNNVANVPFAIKAVKKSKYMKSPILLKKAIAAIEFQERVRSKFICRLVEAFYTKSRTYMVLEYLSNYTMAKVLSKKGKIKEEYIKVFLAEISAALSVIHDAGFVYNNLRLTHIMLDMQGHIKLIDFTEIQKAGTIRDQPNKGIEYSSPEELKGEPITTDTDWWQLGLIAYQIMFGYNPFLDNNQEKIKNNIKDREPELEETSEYSSRAVNLIRDLLKKKPLERLGSKNGFYEILKHEFFEGLKPSVVINRKLQNPYSTKNKRKVSKIVESDCEEDLKYEELQEQLESFVYDAKFDQ